LPNAARSDTATDASSLTGRSVLVTGATGFIGTHLVDRLARDGARVSVLLRAKAERLAPAVTAAYADLLDGGAVRAAVETVRPDVVFHLAAVVNLDRTLAVADACMRTNVLGTTTLLRALEATTSSAVFVLASTTEVYGHGGVPFLEGQTEQPPSPYAVSKVAAERILLLLHRAAGLRAVVVRIATTYGPGQGHDRLIPMVIDAYARGQAPRLHDPWQSRDFVFVDDVVDGLIAAATSSDASGEIINLGDETTYLISHVADTIRDIMGAQVPPRDSGRAGRANEARTWATSREKAGRLLGWTPRTGLVAGLERTVARYLADTRRPTSPPR
jgi:nucleoside-diphosphate-sugar epimerase